MKAGRELDALIAKHVFDMTLRNITETSCELWHGDKWHSCGPCAHYSTDIADAWEVVEKADLWSLYGSIGDGPYRACIQFGDREGLMTADTAPLAICLAALKAKGVTGEQHG